MILGCDLYVASFRLVFDEAAKFECVWIWRVKILVVDIRLKSGVWLSCFTLSDFIRAICALEMCYSSCGRAGRFVEFSSLKSEPSVAAEIWYPRPSTPVAETPDWNPHILKLYPVKKCSPFFTPVKTYHL